MKCYWWWVCSMENKKIPMHEYKLANIIYDMVATMNWPSETKSGILYSRTNIVDEDVRSRHSRSLDDLKIVYKAPQAVTPPCSVTRTIHRRLLHALGPAGQRRKGSAGYSNTTSTKYMNSNYNFGRALLSNVDGGAGSVRKKMGSWVCEEGGEGHLL
jgi:hypothetical protein